MVSESKRTFGTPIDINCLHSECGSGKTCLRSTRKLSKRHQDHDDSHYESKNFYVDDSTVEIELGKSCHDDSTASTMSPVGVVSRSSSLAVFPESLSFEFDRGESLADQDDVLFQCQECEPFDENRVLREIVLDYDGDDVSETVSSASEFSTEDLAELQERTIRENFGEFQFYCDPQSEA